MRTLKRGSYQAQYSRALSAVTVTRRWVAVINQPGRTGCFWLPCNYAGTVIFPLWQLCQLSHTMQYPSPHKKTCLSSHCAKNYQDQWHKWPFYFNNIGNTAQKTSTNDFFFFMYVHEPLYSPTFQRRTHIYLRRTGLGLMIKDGNSQPFRPSYYVSEEAGNL